MSADQLLSVEGLEVTYQLRSGPIRALTDVSFGLDRGQILGVVGESGCGKSTLSAALLGLLPPNGDITAGRVALHGRDLVSLSERELRAVRGREIAMIFQDPLTSLNPTFRVGAQLVAAQKAHERSGRSRAGELRERAIAMLTRVGMPDAHERIDYYPHQFSGGMRQRIQIAMALLLEPDLLIADEATSALDVTLQAQILELLRQLRRDRGTAMLFVSHDLGVVSEICDDVVVMYAGRTVEQGAVGALMATPRHPYTRALLASVPSKERRGERLATIPGRVPDLAALPPGCAFADRCPHVADVCRRGELPDTDLGDRRVRCLMYEPASGHPRAPSETTDEVPPSPAAVPAVDRSRTPTGTLVRLSGVQVHFADRPQLTDRIRRRPGSVVRAVDDVDLEIQRGEIVGLVGESGSGKTTLGRSILGLVPATGGEIVFDGHDVRTLHRTELRRLRRRVQMIFQDSHASLSPRKRVSALLREPYTIMRTPEAERYGVDELLDLVQLSSEQADKYPHELSGGQARRVGIARALSLRPEFIVADEPTAGLDVSAAASVLNLMKDLAGELDLTYLVISHDLNTVGYVADRIALMYLGRIVEIGPTDRVYDRPAHPYARGLLSAVPVLGSRGRAHRLLLPGEIPSPKDPPPGCRFHTRCAYAQDRSRTEVPLLEEVAPGHLVACHFWREVADDAPGPARPDGAVDESAPS